MRLKECHFCGQVKRKIKMELVMRFVKDSMAISRGGYWRKRWYCPEHQIRVNQSEEA
jgi:hypothetical protein